MKKIVFGITSLGLGGAERVLVDMANKLKDQFSITIFTLYGKGEFNSQLSKKIKVISYLDEKYEELSFLQKKILSLQLILPFFRKRIYKKFIKDKYDVEVAFLEGPITWLFSFPSKASKIAWIHNDILDVFEEGLRGKYKKSMNRACYQKYNKLVFVSKDNMKKFNSVFPNISVDKRVIYNYLDCDLVMKKASKGTVKEIDRSVPSFVQVSRIVKQKALFRLLEVHKNLIEEGYQYKIYIVGDGDLRKNLEEKIKEYGLEDSFVLLGQKENPYPYIQAADTFMLTSFYEGYPMVLLEAKALDKFILLTDSAARETLTGYENSLVVPNSEEGIYKGIVSVLEGKVKKSKKKKDRNLGLLKQIVDILEGE